MLFRNRRLVRGLACFLLLETLTTLVAPSVSLAITGPNQVEFTSYEASASPDLVDLTSGDFTYNIPVLEVPGPERSFSLPLTYRAGIKLEQDASWVGLGWSLNAGAIARSLNGYPDDANGEIMKSTYSQKITRGWTGGVPGVLELGWDVNTGHSGSANLIGLVGLGWSGNGISSGSLVGVHASKEGISADPVEMVAAAVTIVTLGTAGVAAVAIDNAKQLGIDVATNVGASVLLGKAGRTGGAWGQPVVKTDRGILHTNYWVFFNDERSESMYGSLNFDEMSKRIKYPANNLHPRVYTGSTSSSWTQSPEFNTASTSDDAGTYQTGPGGDLYQYNVPNADYWENNKQPISIAHDDFSVMGGNVSGNIRPYRLEVGSLAFPFQGLEHHNRYSTVAYLDDYKVPFRYDNSISNGYDYHQATGGGLGIEGFEQQYTYSPGAIVLKDPSLYVNSSRTAPARKGILNDMNGPAGARRRQFVQGKNIKWFSNQDIERLYATSANGPGDGSFLEVNAPTPAYGPDRRQITGYTYCTAGDFTCQPQPLYAPLTQSWHNNPWRVTLPGKGVGAFAITAEDGTTYHYSLPVYHYTQFSKSRQLVADAGTEEPGVSTQMIGPQNWQNTGGGYATTWLLTAITSSDYVDRGEPGTGKLGTVDDSDWGGWVRFDYGRFSNIHKWRQPYLGESASANSYNDVSYAEGYKQTYYLNSIRTRTHTALFVKSVRNDGRSHYRLPNEASGNLGFDETKVASSLRLDEIILLSNEALAKLKTVNGIATGTATGPAIPALSENTAGNHAQYDPAELSLQDSYANVLDTHDLDVDSRIRDYINQNALKRVRFNYSYRLCAGTPNSFTSARNPPSFDESQFACSRTGKLTLESLSIYGPTNAKLTPDFKFTYGFNPDYQKEAWDAFGMYKSGVVLNTSQAPKASHQVSADYPSASTDGAAWSLTEITDPLGGKTRMRYERDQYASVSEYTSYLTLTNRDCSNVFTANVPNLAIYLQPLDIQVAVSSFFSYPYTCYYPIGGNRTAARGAKAAPRITKTAPVNRPPGYEAVPGNCGQGLVNGTLHVTAVSGNTVTIDPGDVPGLSPNCGQQDPDSPGSCTTPHAVGATITLNIPIIKNGGDIRVAAITTADETGQEYQVRYAYTSTGQPTAINSSGVISKEPAFVDRVAHDFDAWFDYPGTSVLYGKTSVLRGLFRSNNAGDYTAREEYTFQTPVSTMVHPEQQASYADIAWSDNPANRHDPSAKGYRGLDMHHNITTINLGMVGQPLAIRKLNRRGEVESSTSFEYGNTLPNPEGIAGQGYFSEGVMTNELLGDVYYRVNRSTKFYQPTMLLATTTKTNGISSRSQQDKFDFYTGQVLESSFRNSLGDQYRSKVVPAYTLPRYAAMGPASEQSTNRNMLSQEAASYLYKVRSNGSQAVVAANVQTWKSAWNTYRGYDAGSDTYTDRADDPRGIWRLYESYLWMSPRTNPDGTYADADFVDFNWNQALLTNQARGWVKAGEFTRYDHYSKPLESKDLNGQYVSRKLGYGQVQRLVTAANARYTEVAYSGAEDLLVQDNNQFHFGGEVRDGGYQTPYYHHTGLYATQVPVGQAGFTYKAALNSEVRGGRKYRLSCWVYGANAAAQLYAKVDGNDIAAIAATAATTKQAGDWYLLNLLVDVPTSGQQLTVGCRNSGITGQTIYVDDFRFHPVESPTTAYVYDPTTARLTDVLDNDNLFTHYEYDAAGQVKRISKEALTTAGSTQPAARVVKEYEYNFSQMWVPTWLPTGVITWGGQGPAGQSQTRQHEERDINPVSATYNTTRLVTDGTSISCANNCPPAGEYITDYWTTTPNAYGSEDCVHVYVSTDGNCGQAYYETNPHAGPCTGNERIGNAKALRAAKSVIRSKLAR
jgi:hypothetical protein